MNLLIKNPPQELENGIKPAARTNSANAAGSSTPSSANDQYKESWQRPAALRSQRGSPKMSIVADGFKVADKLRDIANFLVTEGRKRCQVKIST
jgi:hypothetical protein